MPRKKSGKTAQSINFENEVLKALVDKCSKEGLTMSSFINALTKNAIMSEYEFYRRMAKNAAMELAKYQTLMDTAGDRPR